MSVGLPGTGIGGIFYLMSALWMPFREGCRALAGRSVARSRGLVVRQVFIALGVLGGIWAAGWLMGLFLFRLPAVARVASAMPAPVRHRSTVLGVASFFLAFATLGVVVGVVEVAGAVRRWAARRSVEPLPDDPGSLTRDAA